MIIEHFIGSRQRGSGNRHTMPGLVDCLVWKRGDRAIRVNLKGGAFWQRGQLLKMRRGGKLLWYWSRLGFWNDDTNEPAGFGDHLPWLFSKENIRWLTARPHRLSFLINATRRDAAQSTSLYKRVIPE